MDDAPEFWPLPKRAAHLPAPVGASGSETGDKLGASDPRHLAAELVTLAAQAEVAGLILISTLLRAAARRLPVTADA